MTCDIIMTGIEQKKGPTVCIATARRINTCKAIIVNIDQSERHGILESIIGLLHFFGISHSNANAVNHRCRSNHEIRYLRVYYRFTYTMSGASLCRKVISFSLSDHQRRTL